MKQKSLAPPGKLVPRGINQEKVDPLTMTLIMFAVLVITLIYSAMVLMEFAQTKI